MDTPLGNGRRATDQASPRPKAQASQSHVVYEALPHKTRYHVRKACVSLLVKARGNPPKPRLLLRAILSFVQFSEG